MKHDQKTNEAYTNLFTGQLTSTREASLIADMRQLHSKGETLKVATLLQFFADPTRRAAVQAELLNN